MLFGNKTKKITQPAPDAMDVAGIQEDDDVRGGMPGADLQEPPDASWDDAGDVFADSPVEDASPEHIPDPIGPVSDMAADSSDGFSGDAGHDPDPASLLASPDGGQGSRKPKKTAQKRKAGKPVKAVQERPPRAPMTEIGRQAAFTCGCAAAGVCAVLLVLTSTVMACRLFRTTPVPVLAAPMQVPNGAYYDSDGRMHVDVHMDSFPGREVTIYMDRDGNISTEPPEGADLSMMDPIVLHVDGDGNITSESPAGKPDADNQDKSAHEPFRAVLYLNDRGELVGEQPREGLWRQVDVQAGPDGSIQVDTGDTQGIPAGDMSAHAQPFLAGPVELFVFPDGEIRTDDPGDTQDAVKYTLSGSEDGSVEAVRTADVPQTDDPGN